MDSIRFDQAIATIVTRVHENHGIGTLSEKSVHAVCKLYMEPDEDYHETAIDGYVADIFRDDKVIEIQTGNFRAMKGKLETFLPRYHVTIVHPISVTNTISWVDPKTGEVIEKNKTPGHGTPQLIFEELYSIRPFLQNKNLSVVILMMDTEETRLLDGYGPTKKKRATKYDKVPLRLIEELSLSRPEDYRMLIPIELETFTSAEYAKATKIPKAFGSTAMQILYEMGAVDRVGKTGNAYLYEVVE